MEQPYLRKSSSCGHLTVNGLREKYREAFGEDSRSNHKDYPFRRIARRLQANAEGDLPERGAAPRTGDRERCRPAGSGT